MHARNADAPKVALRIPGRILHISEPVHDRLAAVAAERGATLDQFVHAVVSRDRQFADAAAWGDEKAQVARARALIGEAIQPRQRLA